MSNPTWICSLKNFDEPILESSVTIPRINPEDLSYNEFLENYLLKNLPVMFSNNLTSDWNSRKHWVTPGGNIGFEYLRTAYGKCMVSVTEMKTEMSMDYGGMDCKDMLLEEFLDYWKDYIVHNYPMDKPCLYLKDWHIMLNAGDNDEPDVPYVTPEFFSSDWLNETWEGDDFKFVYMGPKGSWTPFHADVYGSYSWSANIVGRKKWRLYPPGKEKRFLQPNRNLKYDFENPGVETEDFVDIIQESGEVIFVPSGWHHIVWNETDTISINHNWFNAANVCYVWSQLLKANLEVVQELSDLKECEDFFEQCQLVLRANHGMNYETFVRILVKVYESRRNRSEVPDDKVSTDESEKLKRLKSYDLDVIRHIVSSHLMQHAELTPTLKACFTEIMNDVN